MSFFFFFFFSETARIVAMSWKGACSEQLDFPHVAPGPVTQRMESPYGESKGTNFFKWAQGCSSKGCLTPPKWIQSNFTSKCNTAGQSKKGGLLFFKVPNHQLIYIYIYINIFMVFWNAFYKTVVHVQLIIWMYISLCKFCRKFWSLWSQVDLP